MIVNGGAYTSFISFKILLDSSSNPELTFGLSELIICTISSTLISVKVNLQLGLLLKYVLKGEMVVFVLVITVSPMLVKKCIECVCDSFMITDYISIFHTKFLWK